MENGGWMGIAGPGWQEWRKLLRFPSNLATNIEIEY
jgi:hypothetical protein